MATLTLRPTSVSSAEHTAVGAANQAAAVNESTPDDDTTYNKTPSGGFGTRTDLFNFDFSAIGDGDTINNIEVHFRAKQGANWTSSDQIRAVKQKSGGLTDLGSLENLTTSYQDFAKTNYLVMPDDGADLKANYTFGYRSQSSNLGDDDIRITQMWIVVDYTAALPTADSERAAKIHGQVAANSERGAIMAGGDGWYRERFDNTTYKDSGATTGAWSGDGEARII